MGIEIMKLKDHLSTMTEQEEKEYMDEWAEWMDAPMGIPKEDQSHLDSIRQEVGK